MGEMTARAKFALAFGVVTTLLISGNAMAAEEPAEKNNCAILAHYNATKTARALLTFSMDIFGKNPERWTVEDIENLKRNARACDNQPAEYTTTTRVFYNNWRLALGDDSVKRFLAISNKSTQIADTMKEGWPTGFRLPYCGDLIKWRRDPVWLINNSRDIFGRSFTELKEEDSAAIKRYVEACMPVMQEILKIRKQGSQNAAKLTADILTALDRDMSAQRWSHIALVPDLQITHEGQPIPLAYVSNPTREVVLKINTSEQNRIALDIDSLSTISAWVMNMNRRSTEGPDALYVDAVKKIVSRQLFEQEKRYDKP
jgi:hypothetical protein